MISSKCELTYIDNVSVITASLNAEKTIKRCLQSVYNFKVATDLKVNHFIADGGSTDKTLDIIKKEKKSIANLISLEDEGIYDAWNKALDYINDGWIIFLGADDFLLPSITNFIQEVNNKYQYNSYNLISGITIYEKPINNKYYLYGKKINKFLLMHSMQIANCATLYNYKLFNKNKFNTKYKIIGDYDFIMRKRAVIKHLFLKYPISFMSASGVSSNLTVNLFLDTIKCRFHNYKYNLFSIIFILILSLPTIIKLIFFKKK